ncbi:MAG: 16S rRNA (guanine(966)-N(2))-methyltransferase RsmD [Bryobacteraceae bacterium]|nr:16S rRNA (guanine(966)-N(2))-methyltransferase RsmD [Bryobacteraceae bacterium]
MRIIAGEFRSRRLKTLPGLDTRPTPDRLRETLFNIIAPEIEDCTFLDAYAGSGAVGIEALSRGAAQAVFIERNKPAADIIRENLVLLGLTKRTEVLQGRVLQYLSKRKADVVFLDPPYSLELEYTESLNQLGIDPPPLTIAQHAVRYILQDQYGCLRRTRIVKQGDNSLSFFRP